MIAGPATDGLAPARVTINEKPARQPEKAVSNPP
jgi:hypothetical protein